MKRTWVNGVPTTVEVQLLLDTYGVPERGTLIPYTEIEKVLGIVRRTSRYRTVTGAWRRRILREHGIASYCPRDEGIRFCAPGEQVDESSRGVVGGLRRVKIGVAKAVATPRETLEPHELRKLDHVQSVGSMVLLHAARLQREQRAVKGLPRAPGVTEAPIKETPDADAN